MTPQSSLSAHFQAPLSQLRRPMWVCSKPIKVRKCFLLPARLQTLMGNESLARASFSALLVLLPQTTTDVNSLRKKGQLAEFEFVCCRCVRQLKERSRDVMREDRRAGPSGCWMVLSVRHVGHLSRKNRHLPPLNSRLLLVW